MRAKMALYASVSGLPARMSGFDECPAARPPRAKSAVEIGR